eukprot:3257067-Amphidinium_carterae.2
MIWHMGRVNDSLCQAEIAVNQAFGIYRFPNRPKRFSSHFLGGRNLHVELNFQCDAEFLAKAISAKITVPAAIAKLLRNLKQYFLFP